MTVRQLRRIETDVRQPARCMIVDHRVDARQQLRERRTTVGAAQIQRHRLLAGIQVRKQAAGLDAVNARRERRKRARRSEEHTSELQSLMRISYAVFCLTKKKTMKQTINQEIKNTI